MATRTCNRCRLSLEATPDNFLRDKTRPLGLAYECKPCHRERRKGRDRRPERWSNMTETQRDKRRVVMARWNKSQRGRACFLRKAYQRIDACDLTTDEIHQMIVQPCVFCGTEEVNRGLDRIDNSLPHIKGNVQTACSDCNRMRADRFTVKEMKIIGAAVAEIRRLRLLDTASKAIPNADHL